MLLLTLLSLPCVAFAQESRPIVIEWDENHQPGVAGYVVYVGGASGVYFETHDVGHITSFEYPDAVAGRWYYFAVAVYSASGVISEPSIEVPVFANASGPTIPSSGDGSLELSAKVAPKPSAIRSSLGESLEGSAAVMAKPESGGARKACFDVPQDDCFRADLVARVAGPVSSLSATGDGRVFFIEDGEYIRVIAANALIAQPALRSRGAHVRLVGLALASDFDSTRSVYVGEVETLPDGSRELSIVRYRELRNALGEGGMIVTGLAIPPDTEARFNVDSTGHLYVAVPSAPGFERSTRYAYGGMILRFNPDGTTPSDSVSASPILARGFQSPSGLAWDPSRHQLWLSGSDTASKPLLARLLLDDKQASGTRTSLRVPAASIVSEYPFRLGALAAESGSSAEYSSTMFLLDSDDRLVQVKFDSSGSSHASRLDAPMAVIAAAVAPGGVIYVAARAERGVEIFTLRRAK